MPNNISQEQITPRQLERLAAQRYLYSKAKMIFEMQVGLDLLTPLISAITVALLLQLRRLWSELHVQFVQHVIFRQSYKHSYNSVLLT